MGLLLGITQNLVERSRSKARQIDRDVLESKSLDVRENLGPRRLREQTRKIGRADLDPGDAVMVSHTTFAQAQFPEEFLRAFDLAETFAGDVQTVTET